MERDSLKKERNVGLVLFLFSLVFLYGCLNLKIGRVSNPGPGFMPLVVGVLLTFFTGLNLYRTLCVKTEGQTCENPLLVRGSYLAPLGTAVCVVVYPLLLRELKYLLSTFVVVFAMLIFTRYKSVVLTGLVSLAIVLASFIFFGFFLRVVLPAGVLETFVWRCLYGAAS